MKANQILHSSLLDIVFEGRNKEYGAYQLRKTYNRRMYLALAGVATIILLFLFARILAKGTNELHPLAMEIDSTILTAFPPEEPVVPPPPPQPSLKKLPPAASVQFSRLDIMEDKDVAAPPPDINQIENARIDIQTVQGEFDPAIIAPPTKETGTQVWYQAQHEEQEEDKPFIRVEIDAQFPGGNKAWHKYISGAIAAELDEFTNNDFGTVVVKFVVNKYGVVSDVQALNMSGSKLAAVAVQAISKGPKWIPAQQNGRYVSAYRTQPVTLLHPNQ